MPARKPRPYLKWIPIVMISLFVVVFVLVLFFFIPQRADAVSVFDEESNPAPGETHVDQVEPLPDLEQNNPPVSGPISEQQVEDSSTYWLQAAGIALVTGSALAVYKYRKSDTHSIRD